MKRGGRFKRDMWKAEREGRGKAGPKDTCGRLRGRQEGKRGGRSIRDMWKAEMKAGKGRGEASPKETYGRLRGRHEGRGEAGPKETCGRLRGRQGREEGRQVQKRLVEG